MKQKNAPFVFKISNTNEKFSHNAVSTDRKVKIGIIPKYYENTAEYRVDKEAEPIFKTAINNEDSMWLHES